MGTLPIGLFGASTGAAAALVAASLLGDRIGAVVSRGGRPDLAGDMLPHVKAPTLLIVGGADFGVIELNQWALERLGGEKSIEIVPGATHLFPEPGALEAVIELAAGWFERHLVVDPACKRQSRMQGNDGRSRIDRMQAADWPKHFQNIKAATLSFSRCRVAVFPSQRRLPRRLMRPST